MRSEPFIATLPWNDEPVWRYGNAAKAVAQAMPWELRAFVPTTIEVAVDSALPSSAGIGILRELSEILIHEFRSWASSTERISSATGISYSRLRTFLSARRSVQPWLIFLARTDGRDVLGAQLSSATGFIPCPTAPNHGVGWGRENERTRVWLVTSREQHEDWDADRDFGHESAHAAFAPVPLFAQLSCLGRPAPIDVSEQTSPRDISDACSQLIEVCVAAFRGKQALRCGVPPREDEALQMALLTCHRLMPLSGFGRVLTCIESRSMNEEQALFAVVLPALRVVENLSTVVGAVFPPPAEWFAACSSS